MFQSPKLQYPYQRQASVGPVMVGALPSVQPLSPLLPHTHYSIQQQQHINLMENVKIRDNPKAVDNTKTKKDEERDDRPLDPNLVCPTCKQQFRIGEIQEFKKHYTLYHSMNKKLDLDSIKWNVCTCRYNNTI